MGTDWRAADSRQREHRAMHIQRLVEFTLEGVDVGEEIIEGRKRRRSQRRPRLQSQASECTWAHCSLSQLESIVFENLSLRICL